MALCSLVAVAFVICFYLGLPNRLDSCPCHNKLWAVESALSHIIWLSFSQDMGLCLLPIVLLLFICFHCLMLGVLVGCILFMHYLFHVSLISFGDTELILSLFNWGVLLGWPSCYLCVFLVTISILWRNAVVKIGSAKRDGASGFKSPVKAPAHPYGPGVTRGCHVFCRL